MRNRGHQGENELQRKKSEQDQIQLFLLVFGSFTLSSCKTAAKNYIKCAARANFLLIRPTVFVAVVFAVAA